MDYVLQNRWQLKEIDSEFKLVYYGLRNWPKNKEQVITLNAKEAKLISKLSSPKKLSEDEKELIAKFIDEKIVVPKSLLRKNGTVDSNQTCTKCLNNDYVIPGMEFNEDGLCAFCQCYDNENPEPEDSVLVIEEDELVANSKANAGSRFDVMVLFTGGKDSTYLVWHLSKNLGLKVLAVFWNMPYTNNSSRENIKKTLNDLPDVEFIQWDLPHNMMQDAIKKQYEEFGWFCLCPDPAFPLFYPIAAMYKIPYIMFGMEDVQASVMDYVFAKEKKKKVTAREQTLGFLKIRSTPRDLVEPITWEAEMANYHISIQKIIAPLFGPLHEIIKNADNDENMQIPLIKRLRTKEAYGSWQSVIDTLGKEVHWEMPKDQKCQLHTSCKIESVKDYTEFLKYKNMETVFFPQGMVELSAAIYFGHISKEEALVQYEELGFFNPPPMYDILMKKVGQR